MNALGRVDAMARVRVRVRVRTEARAGLISSRSEPDVMMLSLEEVRGNEQRRGR